MARRIQDKGRRKNNLINFVGCHAFADPLQGQTTVHSHRESMRLLQGRHAFAVGVAGSPFLDSIRESMAPNSSFCTTYFCAGAKRRRQGFTIPELLVSMALILFIMVILSQTFVAGADMFRKLKAMGDMQERLRTVSTRLRAELEELHFDDSLDLGGGNFKARSKLSDIDLRAEPPPQNGF